MMRFRLAVLAAILMLAIAGCAGAQPKTPGEWTVTVDVQGRSATVDVTVPGMVMGKDYHPHLKLDGGPEIMLYSKTYTFKDLKPGVHKVQVELSDPEHKPYPDGTKEVSFEVK